MAFLELGLNPSPEDGRRPAQASESGAGPDEGQPDPDPLSEGNRLRPDTERTPLYGCRRGKLEVIEG